VPAAGVVKGKNVLVFVDLAEGISPAQFAKIQFGSFISCVRFFVQPECPRPLQSASTSPFQAVPRAEYAVNQRWRSRAPGAADRALGAKHGLRRFSPIFFSSESSSLRQPRDIGFVRIAPLAPRWSASRSRCRSFFVDGRILSTGSVRHPSPV